MPGAGIWRMLLDSAHAMLSRSQQAQMPCAWWEHGLRPRRCTERALAANSALQDSKSTGIMRVLGALGRFCLLRGGGVQLRSWLAVMVLVEFCWWHAAAAASQDQKRNCGPAGEAFPQCEVCPQRRSSSGPERAEEENVCTFSSLSSMLSLSPF